MSLTGSRLGGRQAVSEGRAGFPLRNGDGHHSLPRPVLPGTQDLGTRKASVWLSGSSHHRTVVQAGD